MIKLELENNTIIELDVKVEIYEKIKKKEGKDTLTMNKVEDVYRYFIDCKNGKLTKKSYVKGNKTYSNSKYKDKSINIDTKYKTIVLLLESPHKDEYDSANNPIAPAQGKTGENIEKYIISVLEDIKSRDKKLLKEEGYRLIVCNPIQYQTSLYMYHKQDLKDDYATLRNQCWRKMWQEDCIRDNFKERIKSYKPELIINACTSSLKDNVTKFLKEKGYNNIYTTYHPSYWNGFNIEKQ